MPKRASLDLNQFKIELPKPTRDPLDAIIPPAPPPPEKKPENLNGRSMATNPTTPVHSGQAIYEAKSERPTERTSDGSNVASNERKKARVKVRHTFDVFADQLIALQTLQLTAVQKGRRKPTLGKMVQQAIDLYLEQPKRKR